jgi:hypothetical protein
MAKKSKIVKKVSKKEPVEKDSVYFLKLVLFFVLGTLWVQFGDAKGVGIPVGLIFGVLLATHEHFQVDRKIEFAVLLIAAVLSYVAPIGFILTI